jgi:hypothetical protein
MRDADEGEVLESEATCARGTRVRERGAGTARLFWTLGGPTTYARVICPMPCALGLSGATAPGHVIRDETEDVRKRIVNREL